MTTSDESWSNKLRQIGDIERPDHHYLTPEHSCVFFGEYTARKGWAHSTTNGIVNNIKKHPDTRGTMQWQYKLRDIAPGRPTDPRQSQGRSATGPHIRTSATIKAAGRPGL